MRRRNNYIIPERPFVATVTFDDGTDITTTIYARNATEAEDITRRPTINGRTVTRIVARSEAR